MRITILTTGSRGDVQPLIALGLGLQQAGHSVKLVTHYPFQTMVQSYGLEFAAMGGDVQGAARFCEVLKFRVLNHLFRGAIAKCCCKQIAAGNVFLLRIRQFN